MNKLPQSPKQHILERKSEKFFHNCLPEHWIVNKPDKDYGVDMVVSIVKGNDVSSYELLIQLKSSEKASKIDSEKIVINVSTYNYLKGKLPLVMLVKYIEEEDEAYYVLLSEIEEPDQKQKTITIPVSKQKKLSSIDWGAVSDYVTEITDYKLTSIDEVKASIKIKF